MKFQLYTLVLVLGCLSTVANAQFNIKAGLDLGLFDAPIENDILDRYNAANTWLTNEMEDIRFIPGLELGFRQRIGFVALDFGTRTKFQNIKAEGVNPLTEALYNRKLNYRMTSYSGGIDIFINKFFLGGSMDLNRYRLKSEQTGIIERETVVNETAWSSHFHIGFEFAANEIMSMRLQPYVQYFWNDVNVFGLEQNFFPDTTANSDDFNTRPFQYGIQFVLYNGNN